MSLIRRALIAAISVGWIAPLTLSFWSEHDFLVHVVWPWVARGRMYGGSFHPVFYADRLFYFAMFWLAAVMVRAVWLLTEPKR